MDEDDLKWVKSDENYHVLVNQFCGNINTKTFSCERIRSVLRDV